MANPPPNPQDDASIDENVVAHVETVDAKQGETEVEIPIPKGMQNGQAIIVLKKLGGDGTANVEVVGDKPANLSRIGRVKAFFLRKHSQLKEVKLKITSEVSSKWEVTVVFTRDALNSSVALRMRCGTCKIFMKTLVTIALAAVGLPPLDIPGLDLVPGVQERLAEMIDLLQGKGPVAELRELFGSIDPRIMGVLTSLLGLADWVFGVADKLYEAACKAVGMCK